jgi:hypothetical protein
MARERRLTDPVVTPLQLLSALVAGPLDESQCALRFGGYPRVLVSRLVAEGKMTRQTDGKDIWIEMTPKGRALVPTRRAMATTHLAECEA